MIKLIFLALILNQLIEHRVSQSKFLVANFLLYMSLNLSLKV